MATYAIGDIQGCFSELSKLLDKIEYNEGRDKLWFAGDLVNRGPNSLKVLRLVKSLPNTVVVLGNHDLHLLTLTMATNPPQETFKHTMDDVLNAPDKNELLMWLCEQPLVHYNSEFNALISHAGIPPFWDIQTAQDCSSEVQTMLRSEKRAEFLDQLFGDEPNQWRDSLTGYDRLRYIVNAFTRMRFVAPDGALILEVKGKPQDFSNDEFIPWFEYDNKVLPTTTILFGHWAALEGKTTHKNAIALDTGCVWGGQLTALRFDDGQLFSVDRD